MTSPTTPTTPRQDCTCHVCWPEPSYDALDRACLDAVVRHGWQVLLVAADGPCSDPDHADDHADDHAHPHGDEQGPAFAYSVGLGHHCDHPELLVSGLDPDLMRRAINDVAGRVAAGLRLAPGDVLEGVLGGVPVVVEPVSEAGLEDAVTWSGWFHRRRPDALALVWPTTSGLFPWQPGAPAVLDELQPRHWREPWVHGGGVAADPDWVMPVPADRRVFSCVHVVELGATVLFAARQDDEEGGEDWTLHCGEGHDIEEARVVHLAHLLRSTPSVRDLADLGLDHEAWREGPDDPWTTAAIVDA